MEQAETGLQGTGNLPSLSEPPSAGMTNPRVSALVARYGDREGFLKTFNPDKQDECLRNPELSYMGGAPTLGLVRKAFGSTAEAWLVIQLAELSEYAGVKEKLTTRQLTDTALLIQQMYGHFKVTELMLFFRQFKSGRYGRFYGSVDPMLIMTALETFAGERAGKISIYAREREKAAREAASPPPVKPADWKRRMGMPEGASVADCILGEKAHQDDKA